MADEIQNTGIQFEDIVPWVDDHGDTGLSARLKLKRNFDKIKAWMDANHIDVDAVKEIIEEYGVELFLSKLNDDTAAGFITFLQGLQVGNQFVSGLLGNGGVFRRDADGKVYIEADKLYVRMKAYFDNVEIKDYEHTSGNRIASKAGLKCVKVEAYNTDNELIEENPQTEPAGTSYYRLYFRAKDGEDTIDNNFVVDDQAFCDKTTFDNNVLAHHRYWRLVVGKNSTLQDDEEFGYIDLSASDKESGSAVPLAGDDVSQLGNRTNVERQGAIIEFVGGENAPAYQIYQGINTYSLSGKCKIDIGFDSQTGLARMNVAGNFRFGSPVNTGSYIKYDSQANQGKGQLDIKAHVEFTNSDEELNEIVQGHQKKYDDDIANLESVTEDLQRQIDGAIEMWFMTGVPTLQNAPANQWTTDDEKDKHIGDLYYDKATTYAYRFLYDDETETYGWQHITDDALAEALRIASEAQETADGKRTVYSVWEAWMKNNVNTLEVGDLFIPAANTTQGGVTYKANKVYKCTTDGSATFQAADYIDDAQAQAKVDAFVSNTYNPDKINLQSQIDGKAETFRQATDPSSSWTDADKPKHVGDLWMDISAEGGNKTYIYLNTAAEGETPVYDWVAQNVPDEVFDEIDGKSTIFGNAIATPPTNYKKNDMWLLPAAATINGVSYKAGDVLSASQESETYSETHWSKKVRYTDDTKADSILNNTYYKQLAGGTINNLIGIAQDAADAAQDAADAAQADATNANNKLTAWADDGKISPTEKLALKNQKADVQKEYAQIITDAAKYSGVSTTAFTTAYNRAITAFDYYTSTSTENIDIITDEEEDSDETPRYSRIAAYYAARQTILEAITTAAKTYATTQGNKFLNDAVYKAISAALGSKTDIVGGLVLTSMIGMRQNTGTAQEPSYLVWGGISGEYDDWSGKTHAKGHGIAAWYGGELLDKETLTKEQIADGWNGEEYHLRWAKSVDRFDGSGYRADGNISWDENGALTIKNITTLSDSNNNNILNELATFNSAFTFGTSGQGSTTALYITPNVPFQSLYIGTSNANKKEVATQEWVGNNYVSTAFFRQLFRAFKPNETAGQADVEVQPNTIDATISNIKAMVGFWTEQYVSALGNSSDGGGGGASVLYGLNDVTPNATGDGVMGAQDGYVLTYNGSTHHWYAAATAETYVLPTATADALGGIKIGYATSGKNYAIALDTNGKAYVNVPWTDHYDWGDITNTPTTIAGYGITDAYTKTEVDSLARLESVAFSSDGVLAFTLQDGSVSYVDLTHQHDFQEILERPTTLAGFGIDDAKIESGVITLGNNTITPVTSVAMTVPTGFSISGTPISKTGTLALSYSSGYEGFTTELKNMITALYSWFEIDSNGDIKTKDYTSNGTTKHRGFWSPSFISALGQGSDSGGGGQGDVTWELLQTQATDDRYIHLSYISAALESYLTTNNYVQSSDISDMATKTWVGNQGYLTQQSLSSYYTKSEVDALARLTNVAYSSDGILAFTHQDGSTTYADFTHEHSFLELLDRPTTIAGYEISDVYINSGVVYIGDNSITPVTSVAMTVPTGFSISGSPISKTGTLAVSYASGYEGFTTSLKEKIEALFSWFELDSDGNVKTKDYVDNGTTKHRGFWSESFISALGEGSDGGGGGQGDVTWQLLEQADTRPINISHLTDALSGYATQSWVQSQGYITQAVVDVLEFLNTVTGGSDILTLTTNKGKSTIVDFTHNHEFLELTDRPTTIAGYGIEDAKIANGVITLGTNTITPLTSHQSVTNNNISVTWDTETTIATIGSTAIKIKIPANPDTNTWRNIFKDGTEQLTTGINTKGLNFVGDGKTTITFLAAGTGEGQSGNANFATLKIGSTWRGIQDNLTSSTNTTESLSAKQGYLLANGSARDDTKLPLTGGTLTGNLTINPSSGAKYIQIGTIRIGYDSDNNALKVYKVETSNNVETEVAANFYALGAISALGQGVDGGGGGQGDVTWQLLEQADTRPINISHLTDALSGYSTTSHTHTTTIATDSGTNQLTLAYGTKYKITAGGTSFVFTMPSADDTNTWRNIYVAGTEKIGSAVSTKGLNFAAGSNVSLSFTAAGSGTGQNANYGTITISATDTTYSVATQSANGLMSAADKTKLDGLEYFNVVSRSSDGVVTLTTNKSNTTILDLTHQHSFLELVDRPTTVAGYGITDMGSQSVNYATSASKATNDSDGNAINSTYLKKSGGTLSNAAFGGQLMIERSGSTNMAAIGFKNSRGVLGYLATQNVDGAFVRYNAAASTSYTILDSSNSSVSLSGSTLSVKINGTTQSLTNTWRGIQDNLTSSTNTTESLSAKQGYLLANGSARDSTKLPLAGGTMEGGIIPKTDDTFSLGDATHRWKYIYANGMWGTSGNALRLGGNDVTLMYLTSNARCGIGTNAPDAKLGVSGNAHISSGAKFNEICIECDNSIDNTSSRHAEINNYSAMLFFQHNTAYGIEMCRGGGNVGIGTNPSYKLHVAGDIYATGGVTCLTSTSSSDIRMKDVQGNVNLNVEQVANAPAIRFLWKKDHSLGMQAGSIAQYWQNVLPETIKEDKEGILSMNYGVAALVAAITTARKVVDHEKEIAQLKNRVKALEDENKMLKTKLIA